MTAPQRLDVVYCTDEDLAAAVRMDFVALSAKAPQLAYGTDGYFDLADPWTLVSPSVDFAANGVASNMVVHLKKGNRGGKAAYVGGGELYAIDSATATTLALRGVGLAAGVGHPPGFGAVTDVEYGVRTLATVIEDVAFELNERYHVDPAVASEAPGRVYNLRVLRDAATYMVLHRMYVAENRSDSGDWKGKIELYGRLEEEALARATVRWGAAGDDRPPTTSFLTRLSR